MAIHYVDPSTFCVSASLYMRKMLTEKVKGLVVNLMVFIIQVCVMELHDELIDATPVLYSR
jgi:hypothetical protein